MTLPLVHKETTRQVVMRYKVEAVVEVHLAVADEKVREFFEIDNPTAEIDADMLTEYIAETTDESLWDLHEITYWDSVDDITVTDTSTEMVAPPAFVPLPGMEGL